MDKPGPTGDFPLGKLNPTDEGGLMVEVREEKGQVVVDFGKKVGWIGMGPDDAIAFAGIIVQHAVAIKASRNG